MIITRGPAAWFQGYAHAYYSGHHAAFDLSWLRMLYHERFERAVRARRLR